jgi:P-type E1-E2 ATPase
VGDVIRAEKDKEFPADMLLLCAPKDIVYVDTMNLDGETNLKEKYLFNKDFTIQNLINFSGELVCDPPNESLDEWDGNIHQSGKIINSK